MDRRYGHPVDDGTIQKRPRQTSSSSPHRCGRGTHCRLFAFDDDYSFGILQGLPHQAWFVARGSKLTERLSYTADSVFDTFPWPQAPSEKDVAEVAKAGNELGRLRAEALLKSSRGLRALYRTLDLPGQNSLKEAHAKLDSAVLKAYGFSPQRDLLAQLLELNRGIAESQKAGAVETGPGIPPNFPDPAALISADCIVWAPVRIWTKLASLKVLLLKRPNWARQLLGLDQVQATKLGCLSQR